MTLETATTRLETNRWRTGTPGAATRVRPEQRSASRVADRTIRCGAAAMTSVVVAAALFVATAGGCASRDRVLPDAPPPPLEAIPIGWGIGHGVTGTFAVTEAEWAELAAGFEAVTDAAEERAAIRVAIATFERIAGTQTPTHLDRAANTHGPAGESGQLDCVDESLNTTRYLDLLEGHRLLRHHVVLVRAFRAPHVLDTHFAAQIREVATGTRWVVDSWFGAAGEPPVIQRHDDWLRKAPLPE